MLWSSAKVESRELTGESARLYNLRPIKPPNWVPQIPNSVLYALRYWSWREDLNPRPADYKSAALPAELRQH
jgi:hypothetical protein